MHAEFNEDIFHFHLNSKISLSKHIQTDGQKTKHFKTYIYSFFLILRPQTYFLNIAHELRHTLNSEDICYCLINATGPPNMRLLL